jgi:hypothetical protein
MHTVKNVSGGVFGINMFDRCKYVIVYFMKGVTEDNATDAGIYIEVDKKDLLSRVKDIEENPLIIRYFILEGSIYKKKLGNKHDVIQDLIIMKKGKMYV